MDKISIIIPVYNVSKYLETCLESVINQSYQDLEILLIDDGSTDNSGKICEVYSEKFANVYTYHKKNGGLSDARNFGLTKCTGSYIYFLDSDDWIRGNTIEILYNLMKEYKADISESQYEKVLDENHKYTYDEKIKINVYTGLEASYNLRSYKENQVVSWNKLYKKELFDNIKFPFGKYHEDEFTTYKLLLICNKVVVTNQKLYFYRQTPNSIINKEYSMKRLDIFEAYEESINFYKDRNLPELAYLTLYNYLNLIYENHILAKKTNNQEIYIKIRKVYYKVLRENFKIIKIKHYPRFISYCVKISIGINL